MRVAIVDDEPLALERLAKMIAALPGYEVVTQAAHGEQALARIRETEPEAVLLDIHMPGMDGLQVARALAEGDAPPAVIFTTAYSEHALAAHEAAAAGYLLKPVRREDLAAALARARRPSRAQLRAFAERAGRPEEGRRYIHANTHKGRTRIPVDEVIYFYADRKYTTVCHLRGRVLIEESLRHLERSLGEGFLRIHRKVLVSVQRIEALERVPAGARVRLRDTGECLPVSRRRLADVRALLSDE